MYWYNKWLPLNLRKISFFLWACFAWIVLASSAYSQDKNTVASVEIKGLISTTEDIIRTKLETQPGKPFTQISLKNDIQRLHELGLFSNIEVQANQTIDGVQVIFHVSENQLLGEIKINGNKNVDTQTILETLKITKERYLAPYALSLDVLAIKELYQKKGYQFAQVKAETRPSSGWVDVYIFIDEGTCVTVLEINFFGNKSYGKSTFINLMQTQENSLFTSSYYNEDTFRDDLLLICNFYRSEGFLDVIAELRDVFYSADRRYIILNISIQEGPLYHVKKISIEGNKLFTTKELEIRTQLRTNDPYKQGDMLKDKSKMERLYGENGYLNIKINPQIYYDYDNHTVEIVYKIQEGSKTYLRKIDIKGNVLTRDDVIRRELLITPGEQFNLGKVENGQSRLRRLQYFDGIKMDFNDTEDPAWKDLLINVEEGRTGNLRFAAGITSDLGAVAEISITKRNFDISRLPHSFAEFFSGESFTGAGQNMEIFFQLGESVVRFKTSFSEPYFLGTDIPLGIDIYKTVRGRESWDEGQTGGQISLGKKIGDDSIIKLIYRLEYVDIDSVDDDAPLDVYDVKGTSWLSTLTLDWTLDTRDDYIVPTRGYTIGLSYEVAGVFLGGDYNYSKWNVRLAWFQTVYTNQDGNKHVISIGSRLGFADAHSPSDSVPIFERFFAGGSTSIRGFEFRTVGPRETAPDRDDDPIGGQFMVLGTLEYSFPIYQDALRMVLFLDAGNVTPTVRKEIFDTMRASVGFGFRLKIPVLGPRPFAFDFGFPVRKEDGDDTQIFSFSFGKPF